MKKLLFILSFLTIASFHVDAQKCNKSKKACSKTCTKKASASTADGEQTRVLSMAESAASADENVEMKVCEKSGATSFFRKSVCEKSGKISHKEVSYDAESKSFVNVSPIDVFKEVEGKVQSVSETNSESTAKKTCSKSAKACSKSGKKCCKNGTKACCKAKAKTEVESTGTDK